jgi:hypothetical protein
MKLNTEKFGLAWAITFSMFWLVCSLFTWLMPSTMSLMSGHMFHVDMSAINWHISLSGVVAGFLAWSILAFATGWLVAFFYNRTL